jgi:hypothetical protein
MDVVDRLESARTDAGDRPSEPLVIETIAVSE